MVLVIPVVNTATDTFELWIEKTNLAINAISTQAVTVNSHANGMLTTGNGFVEGTFGSRNLVGNTLAGGTVATPGLLTITTNVSVTGTTLNVGTVSVNSSDVSIGGVSVTQISGISKFIANTNGLTDQLIYFFSKTTYRAAEFTMSINDVNANAHQLSKVMVIHDTGNTYLTEYAVVYSNNNLGQFLSNANSTHIRTYLTPTVANTTLSGSVLLLVV